MVSTSACTIAKGDGKVKIIYRGMGNDDQGWDMAMELGDRGAVFGADETGWTEEIRGEGEERESGGGGTKGQGSAVTSKRG